MNLLDNICLVKPLTILTGKTVLLNLLQEYIEIKAWLLLAFFLYLQNQLISIHSTVTY